MAFNFNSINQALGQTNIFDPKSPVTQTGEAQQNLFQTSATPVSSPSPSGGSASPNPNAQSNSKNPLGYTPNSRAQVYAGIKGTDTTKAVGGIQTGIQGAQQKLQDRANEYGQAIETQKQGQVYDPSKINQAIQGDDKALQDLSGRMSQTLPKQAEAFKGLDDKELPTLADPLKYEQSWGEIFRPQAGPQYTAGQSNFEDLLLGRNNDFRKIAASLSADQDALGTKNDNMVKDETKKANDILTADWTNQNQAIRDQLTGSAKGLQAQWAEREAAEEARRARLDPNAIIGQEFEKIRPELQSVLKDGGLGGFQSALSGPGSYDLGQFLKINKDLNAQDFATAEDAAQFNRINALLGNGTGNIQAGKIAPDYDFDVRGAGMHISPIIQGKAREQQQMQQMMQQAAEFEAQKAAQDKAAAEAAAKQAADEKIRIAMAKAEADNFYRERQEMRPKNLNPRGAYN